MTISAQVIDTIVEWIDETYTSRYASKKLPATRVTQNGIYSGCLCSTKAKVWGATSANASC